MRLVVDPKIFNDVYYHHELFHLLGELFGIFPEDVQSTYLKMIDKGPDVEEPNGRPHEGFERDEYIQRWKYRKLLPIQEWLDSEHTIEFEELKERFGELDHSDFLFYASVEQVVSFSPLHLDDLQSMGIDELIEFLRKWKPPSGSFPPTEIGLCQALGKLVEAEPKRFASEAMRFAEVRPLYVSTFILGFRPKEDQEPFPWEPILDLCRWAIEQEDEPENIDKDSNWNDVKKAISDLFIDWFKSRPLEIPIDLRNAIWEIIKPLTDDPDPTPERDEEFKGSIFGPHNLSMGSVRGKAIHAVVLYALWIRNHVEQGKEVEERIAKDFDEMPEVRDVLDHHLDLDNDPSLGVHSIYGKWFPWLVKLDPRWVGHNVPKIFPSGEVHYHKVAWDMYIILNHPWDVFDFLKNEYIKACDGIDSVADYDPNGIA